MRPIASAVIAAVLAAAAAGCALAGFDTTAQDVPQNEGANADVGRVKVRNVFLLGGTDPASPAPEQTLYGVLINDGREPVRLERITVEGGGSVQLPGPVTVPPNQPVGVGEQPLGTVRVTGVRGTTVPMTFVFSGAEPLRLNVPIKERTGQYATISPSPPGSPSPTAPGTAPASPSPTPTQPGTPSPSPSPSPTS
ncbi:hypothetical protein [Nonomuraea sp. SYSU D8015]|uniref:hypothetical protein n=1 Tax=Nonomuraea sp. SYSU D8015 TaxID=2593644 RepID=UPI0016604AF4|nr:hypothetical protein [Nonomuraea sp. SYSU D8015]